LPSVIALRRIKFEERQELMKQAGPMWPLVMMGL